MKIKSIKLYELGIPFRYSINHTLKSRRKSQSIIIEIETLDGTYHYGEGAPREYVINEPMASIKSAFSEVVPQLNIENLDSIASILSLSHTICDKYKVSSLATAIECAMLDILSKKTQKSIESLIHNDDVKHKLCPYSGILTFRDRKEFIETLELVKKLSLPQVKLKVGNDHDIDNIKLVREVLGKNIDLRLDANRAWTMEQALNSIPEFYEYDISSIEEPLLPSEVAKLSQLSKDIDIPIMLDESIYNMQQAVQYSDTIDPSKLKFNLKLSKFGGPLRASEVFQYAHARGIMCSLGCNVGESAILSSMGRIFAQAHELSYLEGSYSRFFMERDISLHDITFSKGGISKRITELGLGTEIKREIMQVYSQEICSYDK